MPDLIYCIWYIIVLFLKRKYSVVFKIKKMQKKKFMLPKNQKLISLKDQKLYTCAHDSQTSQAFAHIDY